MKKFLGIFMILLMIFSFAACSTNNINVHTHNYSQTVKNATCSEGGYTEHKCSCGDSYTDNCTDATYKHNFIRTRKIVGDIDYETTVCSVCDLEVFSHGNADGSWWGGNDNVKYYVTGKVTADYDIRTDSYHIVVYGEGAMPDFSENYLPMWQNYLSEAVKITVAEGITSIGKRAFYLPDGNTKITFEMADSVKTVKYQAICLNMTSLTFGKGVERIEGFNAFGKEVKAIYLPRSVKFFEHIGGSWDSDTIIYYAGTKEEFLAITTEMRNSIVTIKSLFDSYYSDTFYSPRAHVYLNCSNLYDMDDYFDTLKEWGH